MESKYIINSKSEILNSRQIRNNNVPNSKL